MPSLVAADPVLLFPELWPKSGERQAIILLEENSAPVDVDLTEKKRVLSMQL